MRDYFEYIVARYEREGWAIIYPGGSSEQHPVVGRVGGFGVFFGDSRDVAEPLPPSEEQTNNRGELRAAIRAMQGHVRGTQSLICPDSAYVVDNAGASAQVADPARASTTC